VAEKLEESGDLTAALEHLTNAAREAPTGGRWLKVAHLASRAGKGAAQVAALSEAKAFGELTPRQRRELEQLEREVGSPRAP
jgi:hypothetical protein